MKKPSKLILSILHYPLAIPRAICLLPLAAIGIVGILMKNLGENLEDWSRAGLREINRAIKTPAELYSDMLSIETSELKREELLKRLGAVD